MIVKWRPSKAKAREFAAKMDDIDRFCVENGINASMSNDSYYFTINEQRYRISNHTIETSNSGAYNEFGEQIREKYHSGRESDVIYITAGKTRIIEIYNALKSGKILDKRGNVKEV